MKTVISFDLHADMGFLKKPDINEKVYLTYNMLHKPCVLGILGAIVGLQGFTKNKEFPNYYKKLKSIPIGIKPIGSYCDNGNFSKIVIKYNNATCFANKGIEGNPNVQAILNIAEQTLIRPAYRIFLLLDLEKENEQTLYNRIRQQEASFIPYLGKNDYSAWWYKEDVKTDDGAILFQGVKEYNILQDEFKDNYKIETVFVKQKPVVESVVEEGEEDDFSDNFQISDFGTYVYFEKLPLKYNEQLYQYDYADFALTDSKLKVGSLPTENLYHIQEQDSRQRFVVQLN
ncbi:type I-B CRISPR-associated protein Cas5 [Maribellus comscasis]|uniref:Type I-B CRISPR-associated protein Cas5 n=1 Tax=Maribellus comscasis TaxID=2681766 RepID=A0A6I6JY73_9BACT|nr:type I-B CRISPR-associated protein Cas5 [Maribellus comscasis]QGY47491.1 type I-B CRISPR-associated protein Cas5 [Maribellus comscasis]